ncbi:thiol-disulfide oxidoreductase ResA [Aquibacillus koreensis]|uniref:Thiol-disulfide oxidoreductase ResA n=1 Tax=Aquibacillus koreensis TaxID=279446 RepID=A0A9X3WI25_9BACI|nr:thiol-disulfide oxidoreductase ResA [Aquibacillus koreensis]MCT2537429.1 thiol-disulfide oxidoreductase ResA [Aquibacillus koreensis]MDC3418875.1 thiol-disulfide oxidoreductase ResA [Aquibacillus koreensis]
MSKVEQARQKKSKKKMKRFFFRSIILIVLLAALVFALVSNLTKDKAAIGVGDEAPSFQLKQINNDGQPLHLDELKGKGIMLNFWATFCKPCEQEMPYMESLYPKYKEQGVEIVAVSVDFTELVIEQFVERHNLTFPILHDNTEQVRDLYNVGPLPTTYFINAEGEVVELVSGQLTLEDLEGYLQQIVPKE